MCTHPYVALLIPSRSLGRTAILLLLASIWILPSQPLTAQVHSRPNINSFTAAERCQLRNLMVTFLNLNSASIVYEHQNPAPMTFPDIHCYNEFFLTWHREYIGRMEAWLLTQNGGSKYVPLPAWDPATSIPCEFFNSSCGTCPGSAIASGFSSMNNQNPSGYDFSRFLTTSTLCSYTSGTMTPPQFGKPARLGTAIDNFAFDLQSEHNDPHVSIGGVMGTGLSPAASIFWLWHGFVDDVYRKYQCDCQSDTDIDLFIADSNEDIGNEPNNESSIYYLSPEVWVRNTQDVIGGDGRYTQEDNPLRHQNPEAGQTNYIYVRVRNLGCEMTQATDVDLRVYFSKAATGLNWPTNWVNYMILGVTYGDEITAVPLDIPALAPGDTYTAEIPWSPPNPADFGETMSHICLLARLESTADPMAFAETASTFANTRNNNNIAWKNVTVVNLNPFDMFGFSLAELPVFIFDVIQPPDVTAPIKLEFVNVEDFPDGNIFITAEPEVMEGFLQRGQIQGVEVIEDETGKIHFQIFGDRAVISDLMLAPGERVPIQLKFDLRCNEQGGLPCANFGETYRFDVRQFAQVDFGDEFIGAVAYEIRIVQSEETRCDPLIADAEIRQPECANFATGAISLELRGSEPYTFYWSNGGSESKIEGLLPGEYGVTVVDAQNCIDTRTFQVTDLSDLRIDFEIIASACGPRNGAVKAEVSGGTPPYTYAWSTGAEGESITDLPFGQYILTVTDAAQCQRVDTAALGVVMMLGAIVSAEDASGSDQQDGRVEARPTGGVPPYEIRWSTGAENVNVIENLSPGDYVVTITDQNNCMFVDTARVDVINDVFDLQTDAIGVYLSPTPVTNVLRVQLVNWSPPSVEVAIFDPAGRLISRTIRNDHVGGGMEIDVADLPAGIYMIALVHQQQRVYRRFVKH